MKLIFSAIGLGLGALLALPQTVAARPPTVQFSPGYEMRLAEQRAKLQQAQAPRLKTAPPVKQRGRSTRPAH